MEWLLGVLCIGWTTREIACLVAGARRRARLLVWVEWIAGEARTAPRRLHGAAQRPR